MSRYRTLFLDLDDTLYPQDSGLWQAISQRIDEYMTQRVGLPAESAQGLRRRYLEQYGTTLHGLIVHHKVDPHDYLAFVHNVPVEDLVAPSPDLQDLLRRLPQRKAIFTNASEDYVRRVLRRLGVEDLVDVIVDILALGLVNKPRPAAYQRALALAGETDPWASVLVDDRMENLEPARHLGMTTVLVAQDGAAVPCHIHIRSIHELLEALPELMEGEA